MSGPFPINSSSNIVASSAAHLNPIGLLAHQPPQNTDLSYTLQGLQAPLATKRSLAEDLVAPSKFSLERMEEHRKLWVGKIPKGLGEEVIERLLRACCPSG